MTTASSPRAMARARWLAELAETLDEARRLVERLAGRDANALAARIEVVSKEVELLRRGAFAGAREIAPVRTIHPDWFGLAAPGNAPAYTPCGKSPPPENSAR